MNQEQGWRREGVLETRNVRYGGGGNLGRLGKICGYSNHFPSNRHDNFTGEGTMARATNQATNQALPDQNHSTQWYDYRVLVSISTAPHHISKVDLSKVDQLGTGMVTAGAIPC